MEIRHSPSYFGIVTALAEAVAAAGGTLTTYPPNYEGIVKALEDLKDAITSGGGGTPAASAVTFTPTGTIAATNAQAAIAEAASEALQKSSNLSDVASASTSRTNLGAAESGVNGDITSLTGVTGLITVGGKKHTRSATQPTSPATGDTWEELDGSSNLVMAWFWNGTYWLSQQLYRSSFPDENIYASTGTLILKSIPFDGTNNIYFTAAAINFVVQTTNNATNYWQIDFQYRRRSGAYTTLATKNTSTLTAGNGNSLSAAINTQLVLSDTEVNSILRSAISLTFGAGTPGSFQLVGADFFYRWARK